MWYHLPMKNPQQILLIHGGSCFDSHEDYLNDLKTSPVDLKYFRSRKDWKDSIQNKLGEDFDVLQPKMPNKDNANYEEWKILFDKIVELLDDEVILVGHSLGGIFLAKYLSENTLSKKIKALFLIAAPFDNKNINESLGSFLLPEDLGRIEEQVKDIFLYYSKDDVVVPFLHGEEYKNKLPSSKFRVFEDRGHFKQEEFGELVGDIKGV